MDRGGARGRKQLKREGGGGVGDEAEVTPRDRPPVGTVGGSYLRRADASANGKAQTQRSSGGRAFAGS